MNSKTITYLIIIIIGLVGGYVLSGAGLGHSAMSKAPDSPSTAAPKDMHDTNYNVPSTEPTPTIALQVFADSMSGWNAHFITTNFTYDPANVGGDDAAGHGHIHVLVDGVKVNRSYGDWYHLDALKLGKHTITAELRTNKHEAYYVNGVQVKASVDITQPGAGTADAAQAKVFTLTVKGGKVVSGNGEISVTQGDSVKLVVTNDKDEELHLHGYGIMTELKAGEPGTLAFQATASGRFPFELEGSKTDIGTVSVLPR